MYRDVDEIRLGEKVATALTVIRQEIAGLRRLLDEAEARAEHYEEECHRLRAQQNAVPHPEVAHASREGPAEVSGDEVPPSQE